MKETKRIIYPILLILAAMIWGFAFSAQKSADETPPLLLGTLRSVFAAVFLFFTIVIRDKIKGEKSTLFKKSPFSKYEIAGGVICGVTLAASNLFQQLGLNAGTDAGKASFITALYVLFVPIYALAIGKRPRMNAVISMLIALVGFYFLCITEQTTLAPSDLLVLVAALIFPIYILAIDKYSDRADALKISLIQFIVSALTSFIPSLFFEFPVPVGSVSQNILYIIILGLVAFGISTAGGLLFGRFMCFITKGKINPLIGSAGVSAVPMAARVAQVEGQKNNPKNFLLMHAMGPNVAGVIGSAVAAGVLLSTFG
jgi:oxaloacetate decarboxylase beta subunit